MSFDDAMKRVDEAAAAFLEAAIRRAPPEEMAVLQERWTAAEDLSIAIAKEPASVTPKLPRRPVDIQIG